MNLGLLFLEGLQQIFRKLLSLTKFVKIYYGQALEIVSCVTSRSVIHPSGEKVRKSFLSSFPRA